MLVWWQSRRPSFIDSLLQVFLMMTPIRLMLCWGPLQRKAPSWGLISSRSVVVQQRSLVSFLNLVGWLALAWTWIRWFTLTWLQLTWSVGFTISRSLDFWMDWWSNPRAPRSHQHSTQPRGPILSHPRFLSYMSLVRSLAPPLLCMDFPLCSWLTALVQLASSNRVVGPRCVGCRSGGGSLRMVGPMKSGVLHAHMVRSKEGI